MEFDATFLIVVISFLVFIFIMNKIFYAPILNIMQERQKLVENNFTSAKNTSEETDKRIYPFIYGLCKGNLFNTDGISRPIFYETIF